MTTKQVKTKADFQAKHAQEKKDFLKNKKRKNPNHVVTPNLTPRGRDIKMRLQNKSLDTEGERSYTLNEDIVNTRFMSKHELRAAAEANQKKINSIQESLKNNASKQEKAKAEAQAEKAKAEASKSQETKPQNNG